MSKIAPSVLKSKFRGCLLGALMGDCTGAPYEASLTTPGDIVIIQRYFDGLESPNCKGPYRSYTDDTAMMKSIAQSLVEKPEADCQHMAKLFVKEYYTQPRRGYGQNVIDVFAKLRSSKFRDIYKPAREQFDGSGSFGNGGAMRIAPIPIFYHDNYKAMIDAAKNSTMITHTNPLGINGAILQCLAIHQAFSCPTESKLDPQEFCEQLQKKIEPFEAEYDDGLDLDDTTPYKKKLDGIKELLKTDHHDELDADVIDQLGNNISAYESVPTAIYCFLRAVSNDISTVKTDNLIRRTIQYAITLGGDTDTIACMAGAIAGAYIGMEGINTNLLKQCESHEEFTCLADALYEASLQ